MDISPAEYAAIIEPVDEPYFRDLLELSLGDRPRVAGTPEDPGPVPRHGRRSGRLPAEAGQGQEIPPGHLPDRPGEGNPGPAGRGGSTPLNRDSGGRGLKNAGPPSIPPGMVAKPCHARHTDGPAEPILPQPRLHRTGPTRPGQHPRPWPQGTPLPMHDLRPDLRRHPRHAVLPAQEVRRPGDDRHHAALPRLSGPGRSSPPSASTSGTVADWRDRAGRHARQFHEQRVLQGRVELGHVQADELYVKAVARRTWMAMAMAVPSRLWLGGVGQRAARPGPDHGRRGHGPPGRQGH